MPRRGFPCQVDALLGVYAPPILRRNIFEIGPRGRVTLRILRQFMRNRLVVLTVTVVLCFGVFLSSRSGRKGRYTDYWPSIILCELDLLRLYS